MKVIGVGASFARLSVRARTTLLAAAVVLAALVSGAVLLSETLDDALVLERDRAVVARARDVAVLAQQDALPRELSVTPDEDFVQVVNVDGVVVAGTAGRRRDRVATDGAVAARGHRTDGAAGPRPSLPGAWGQCPDHRRWWSGARSGRHRARGGVPAQARLSTVVLDTSRVSAAPCRGSPDALTRLVRNLLENAVRYAASRVEVTLTETTDQGIRLEVFDDGRGIAPADRERIFERFIRLEPDRGRVDGGTGLGLSICREIVRSQGGSIRFADVRPGARVVVEWPPAAAADHAE